MVGVDVGQFVDLASAQPEEIERAARLAYQRGVGLLNFAAILVDGIEVHSPSLRLGLAYARPLLDHQEGPPP
jgi:hypothetical protein